MKFILTAALLVALYSSGALAAADAGQRTFAVMSLIGDSLTVVTARPTIGSHIDRNDSQSLDDPSGALDLATLHAVDEAIKKVDPQAAPILLATDSPVLRKQQSQLIDNHHLVDADGLVGQLKQAGATDFILITKHRASTSLQAKYETLGSGALYGLGFYLDGSKKITRSDTGETGVGFLAPYAYFQISLVDVATLTLEKEVNITAGQVLSNARNQSDSDPNPWNILDGKQKFKALADLIRENVMESVPEMIARVPAAAQASP